ncbi:MAG: zinc dependent phospholipase C family protein, partial [Candidatus Alcyoniella australis]|nr:zinc dependent phospholipase C family protein [Candidatus Alcyoniella australis]
NLGMFAPYVAKVISRHRAEFLYGIVAADITMGKNFARSIHHCHAWSVAKAMHAEALSEASHSFCYGYQAHLASDAIAHSYYIPNKLIISYRHHAMRHTYWETRFESYLGPEVWSKARVLARRSFAEQDELMQKALRRTLFPFKVNKQIFNSMMLLGRLKRWQQLVAAQSRRSQVLLKPERVQHYIDLSIEASMDFLSNPDSASIMAMDPTGREAIRAARSIRRNLRWLDRRGLLKVQILDEIALEFTPPKLGPLIENIERFPMLAV